MSKKILIFSAMLGFAILLAACQPVQIPTALPSSTPTITIISTLPPTRTPEATSTASSSIPTPTLSPHPQHNRVAV